MLRFVQARSFALELMKVMMMMMMMIVGPYQSLWPILRKLGTRARSRIYGAWYSRWYSRAGLDSEVDGMKVMKSGNLTPRCGKCYQVFSRARHVFVR